MSAQNTPRPSVISVSSVSDEDPTRFSDEVYEDTDSTAPSLITSEASAVPAFVNPTPGVLTSPFGDRRGRAHNGIDIGADAQTEVVAAESGRVVFSGWADGYGYYLILSHENGYETAYGHCSVLEAEEGDRVTKGQRIAYVGSTGNSTGPHLHFEVKQNGVFVDPLHYVTYETP